MISDTRMNAIEPLAEPLADLAAALCPLAGARIALVAPASGVNDGRIDTVLAVLAAAGIETHLGAHARDHHRYLAGTAEARLADLQAAFEWPGVEAVWCLRGGYGCAHFVDAIDWSRIPENVPLIGYSDVTVLLEAFHQHGRPAIHGPTAADLASPGDTAEQRALRRASIGSLPDMLADASLDWPMTGPTHAGSERIGRLVGGNLTTLASMVGTGHGLALSEDSVLLLEDVGEAEFRLERCFRQVLASIDRSRLQAVVLGSFERCTLADGLYSLTRIFSEALADDTITLAHGLHVGHGVANRAWRYGQHVCVKRDRLTTCGGPTV